MKSLRQSFLLKLLTRGQLSITVEHNFDRRLTFVAKLSFAYFLFWQQKSRPEMWMKLRPPQLNFLSSSTNLTRCVFFLQCLDISPVTLLALAFIPPWNLFLPLSLSPLSSLVGGKSTSSTMMQAIQLKIWWNILSLLNDHDETDHWPCF